MVTVNPIFETFISGLGGAGNFPYLSLAPAGEKIKTPDERREEWLRQRWGKFTASEFHKLMANGKIAGELSAGAREFCKQKAAEMLTEPTFDGYVSPAMQWGLDHELEAVLAFEEKTGLKVEDHTHNQVFLTLGDSVGGTPDGLIKHAISGIEIKCPSSKTHLEHMGIYNEETLKEIAPEYYWQVQGLMLISGYGGWWYVSFDPRFKDEKNRLHMAQIKPNQQDIDRLVERLGQAIDYRDWFLGRFG